MRSYFSKGRVVFNMSGFHKRSWSCNLRTGDATELREYADGEADARAKMPNYLIENGLIIDRTLEESSR